MNYEIVVATSNKHKMSEYRALIKGLPITLYSLSDLGITSNVIEDGSTYKANALLKAEAIKKYTTLPILSDDSGLEISFLGEHFPGLYTSRYAASCGGQTKTNEFLSKEAIKYPANKAIFYCTIVLLNIEDNPLVFEGQVEGKISSKIEGENGFGYDPIFIGDKFDKSFGALSEEIKNANSHRAKAFKKFITYLKISKLI